MTRCIRRTAVLILFCSLALPAWGQQYYIYEPRPLAQDEIGRTKDGVLVKEVPIQEGDTLFRISRKSSGYGMYYPQILLFNDIKNPNLIHTGDTLKIPLPRSGVPDTPVSTEHPRIKGHKRSAKAEKKSSSKSVSVQKKRSSIPEDNKIANNPAELSLSELKKPGAEIDRERTKNKKIAHKVAKKVAIEKTPAVGKSRADSIRQKADFVAAKPAAAKPAAEATAQQLFEKAVKAYRQDDCRTALELFDRYLVENPSSPVAADASLYKAECYLKLSAP